MNSVIARPQRQRPPGQIQPQRQIQLYLPRGRRARRATAIVLLIELGLVAGFAAVYRPFDLSIYLWGGHAVTHGLTLYLQQARANWFTYPPFAAALFTPLAVLPGVVVSLAWELGSVAAFAWACLLTLRLAGRNPSGPVLAATSRGRAAARAGVSHAVPRAGEHLPARAGADRRLARLPRPARGYRHRPGSGHQAHACHLHRPAAAHAADQGRRDRSGHVRRLRRDRLPRRPRCVPAVLAALVLRHQPGARDLHQQPVAVRSPDAGTRRREPCRAAGTC